MWWFPGFNAINIQRVLVLLYRFYTPLWIFSHNYQVSQLVILTLVPGGVRSIYIGSLDTQNFICRSVRLIPSVHSRDSVTSKRSCCGCHRVMVMTCRSRQSSWPIISSCDSLYHRRSHVRNEWSSRWRNDCGRRWAATFVYIDVGTSWRAARDSGWAQAAWRRFWRVVLPAWWRHQAVCEVVVVGGGGELAGAVVLMAPAWWGQGVVVQGRHL